MNARIIGLQDWAQTPAGSYALAWERGQFDRAVADIFGFHALQLGWPELPTLRSNRMPHQWLALRAATPSCTPELVTDFSALPFPAASLDLVTLPHTLETDPDPHATLREVARVLVPEGRVVISGFNSLSLWGLRHRRDRLYARWGWGRSYLPPVEELITDWRLRDWLRLLDFEIELVQHGVYRPSVSSQAWLKRWAWLDVAGQRWWPFLGGVYVVVAVKRVHGVRLIGPAWRSRSVPAARAAGVVQRAGDNTAHKT